MVVLAPMARASERMATALNPGFLKSARNAYVKSWRMMMDLSRETSAAAPSYIIKRDDPGGRPVGRDQAPLPSFNTRLIASFSSSRRNGFWMNPDVPWPPKWVEASCSV
jgi:hypothetical protein